MHEKKHLRYGNEFVNIDMTGRQLNGWQGVL